MSKFIMSLFKAIGSIIGSFIKVKGYKKSEEIKVSVSEPTSKKPKLLDKFTPDKVKKMFPNYKSVKNNIDKYLPYVLEALEEVKITDTEMVLMALATIRAESESFKPISEYKSKYNTDPGQHPFNRYDDRSDLGNRGKPDGERYKGRGFIQLTGRHNYKTIGFAIGVEDGLLDYPESANDPNIAAAILAHYIKSKEGKIRNAVKTGNLRKARRLVNGGSHGLDRFVDAYNKGAKIFL
jgi:peptidoglycan L-alanyl-D-glutamate endopeptidase CwlK